MWIEEMGVEISCGMGWIPSIERFLEVIKVIDDHAGMPGSVHSIKAIGGDIQIDMVLPTCECEQSILQLAMTEWLSHICEVCGHEGTQEEDRVRCEKHRDDDLSKLCSVKPVSEPGIPIFKKSALISSTISGGFWLAEYRLPSRILPPYETGRVIDQTSTHFEIQCDKETGRAKIAAAKSRKDMHLTFLDVESYNALYATGVMQEVDVSSYPELERISLEVDERRKISRREAYKRYISSHTIENTERIRARERNFIRKLLEEFEAGPEAPYITGRSALRLIPPDKFEEASFEASSVLVAGMHTRSTWKLLGNEGLYESPHGVKRAGAILPKPLVANHERALFDELYDASLSGRGMEIDELEGIDGDQVESWIMESSISGPTKLEMLRMLREIVPMEESYVSANSNL